MLSKRSAALDCSVTLTSPFWAGLGGRRGGRWGTRVDGVSSIHLVAVVVPLQCCMTLGHQRCQTVAVAESSTGAIWGALEDIVVLASTRGIFCAA